MRRLYDSGGLYLEISPRGGKWWRLKYQFQRKEKRMSLGVYPVVSLEQARLARDSARKLLASGIDPSALRQQNKARLRDETSKTCQLLNVTIGIDGKIFIKKGRSLVCLTMDEALAINQILFKLIGG
jgi:hypothetical protein